MKAKISTLLENVDSGSLGMMMSFHKLGKPQKKANMVSALAQTLSEAATVKKNLAELLPAERTLLDLILMQEGFALVQALQDALDSRGLTDAALSVSYSVYRDDRPEPLKRPSRRFADVLAHLMLRGLVFSADHMGSQDVTMRSIYDQNHRVVVPDEVRARLPAPQIPVPQPLAQPPERIVEASARTLQRDLFLYRAQLEKRPVGLTQKGEVTKADLRAINANLLTRETLGKGEGELEHPRLRFLRSLLVVNQLVGSDLRQAGLAPLNARPFFSQAPQQRIRLSFDNWLKEGDFNEGLLLLPFMEIGPAANLLFGTAMGALARERVIHHLKTCTQEGWLRFQDLCDLIAACDYEFLAPREMQLPWSRISPYEPVEAFQATVTLPSRRNAWSLVEAGFIRAVLSGPLHWLGLLDLGWSDASLKQPDVFRLTALGRWVLQMGPEPKIKIEGGKVIVQPNLHIMALDPIGEDVLLDIEQFAERLSAERAVEYRLTRESVYAGQQNGWSVERIGEYLRRVGGQDLPGNVARTLQEWQVQHERITIYPLATILYGEAGLLDEMASDPALAGRLTARLHDNVFCLSERSDVDAVTRLLLEKSVPPRQVRPSAPPAEAVTVSEDGRIHFLVSPNLYLLGHLAVFADAEKGGYRINAASLKRALRARLDVPEVIRRLEQVHRGPLPAGLVRNIQIWAGHFGDARLETVRLLQFDRPEVLEELRKDGRLARLLKPFAPPEAGILAVLKGDDLEKLRALLAEYGIDLVE